MLQLYDVNLYISREYKSVVRSPLAWVGKKVPSSMYWDHHWRTIDRCDDCQRMWLSDEMFSLLYPQSPADFALQREVGVEECQTFCPDCLAEIEADADRVDPDWRKRHCL